MCGISGIYSFKPNQYKEDIVADMNQFLVHRGPDDGGIYSDETVALGHRRLSILDLSFTGHQPMANSTSRYHIVFNGEIYNFQEIKSQLTDYPFKSETDTEVILAAYAKWGKECLKKLNGMFAFAIWDREKEELFIARDRIGKKPFYYYSNQNYFVFASELRALLSSNLIPRKINLSGVNNFLKYYTVQAPSTIVKDVYMLLPGHYMIVNKEKIDITKYWGLSENVNRSSVGKTYDEVCKNINFFLKESVKKRLISDVPLGAFLSGGIDSSIIVGLMSELSSKKVKTFSVTFNEDKYSEARYAKIIADRFNTDHHEIRLHSNDLLKSLPAILSAIDHPTTDGINSYVVSKATKEQGITVALSGVGGDELFAGYDIIFGRLQKLQKLKWLWHTPLLLRKTIALLINGVSPSVSSSKIGYALVKPNPFLKNVYPILRQGLLDNQIQSILSSSSYKPESDDISNILQQTPKLNDLPFLSQISIAELRFYLQSILLRDIDQMSMAHSLEVRAPFLDFELIEYVLGVKDSFKQPTTPKKLLIDSVAGLIPDTIINRPKMGFTFPLEIWMRNNLKEFCNEHIHSFANRPFSNKEAVLTLWENFLKEDKRVNYMRIWTLVVLESWLAENKLTI